MLYDRMIYEQQKLEKQIASLQEKLKSFPDGKLICTHNGKYHKWYCSDGKRKIYIPKKERRLAEKLAIKNYYSLQLQNLFQEKLAIDSYLNHHDQNASLTEHQFLSTSGYKELIQPIFTSQSQELLDWMKSPYEKNDRHPEQLIHKTQAGTFVRSKSESLIAMSLYKNKIPFRYECTLRLGEIAIFPDFTIRHPKTGELFYWEHFGLMDDSGYCKNVNFKHQLYIANGIIPTIQLITTYETKDSPLDVELVEKIVEHYFLE